MVDADHLRLGRGVRRDLGHSEGHMNSLILICQECLGCYVLTLLLSESFQCFCSRHHLLKIDLGENLSVHGLQLLLDLQIVGLLLSNGGAFDGDRLLWLG